MPITQQDLAHRLKAARLNAGLTQQQVADHLGISRTAVVQMEARNRIVNSLELSRISRLYGRRMEEFFGDEPLADDPAAALLHSASITASNPAFEAELRRCIRLCREATELERLLGLPTPPPSLPVYTLDLPSNRSEAIAQGRSLAEQERNRLCIGESPAWGIAEMIRRQSVRTDEFEMPPGVSGLFFQNSGMGRVIAVNRNRPLSRRLSSYAHEYCHFLADRSRPGGVSHDGNKGELAEARSDAFASHFLMPEDGVFSFLRSVGKGETKRSSNISQEIQVHDLVRLAHHFGTGYDATLHHLVDLKVIDRVRFEALTSQSGDAPSVVKALRLRNWENENLHWTLTEQVLALAFEAFRRGAVSRGKLNDLAADLGVGGTEIEEALAGEGFANLPVEALAPEHHA